MNHRQLKEFIDVQPLTANSQGDHPYSPDQLGADGMHCMARLGDVSKGIARPCLGFVGNVSARCAMPVYLQQKRPQHVHNDQDA